MDLNIWIRDVQINSSTVPDTLRNETMGPPLILATWKGLFAGSLSFHFIINAAAQASRVCGSSLVTSGDVIVGLTWGMTAHQRTIPCFDSVDSAVDGLSSTVDMVGFEECRRSKTGGRCGVYSQIFADGVSYIA